MSTVGGHVGRVVARTPIKGVHAGSGRIASNLSAHELHVLHLAHVAQAARQPFVPAHPGKVRAHIHPVAPKLRTAGRVAGRTVRGNGGFTERQNAGGSVSTRPAGAGSGGVGYFDNPGSGDLAAKLAGVSWVTVAEIVAILAAGWWVLGRKGKG